MVTLDDGLDVLQVLGLDQQESVSSSAIAAKTNTYPTTQISGVDIRVRDRTTAKRFSTRDDTLLPHISSQNGVTSAAIRVEVH